MTEPTGKYAFGKRGDGRNQKRIGVAIDTELEDWLGAQPNKNRYINGLIRKDKELHQLRANTKATGKNEGELLQEMREAWNEKRQQQDAETVPSATSEEDHRKTRRANKKRENPPQGSPLLFAIEHPVEHPTICLVHLAHIEININIGDGRTTMTKGVGDYVLGDIQRGSDGRP